MQYYDTNIECVLSVDASTTGVGAVLLQNNLPIAYASKAFTSSQKNWAQIEKEMYAIVFGSERFHQYIIGKTTVVESDHKPLIPIFNKCLSEIPVRLQKMRMRLQPYDLQVVYKPDTQLHIADTLSRAHLRDSSEESDIETYIMDLSLAEHMSNKMRDIYVLETKRDNQLLIVLNLIRLGWPTELKDVPELAKAYHTYHSQIFEHDGLLYKNERVIVPAELRRDVLNKLHYNHFVIDKTKNRAREIVFWPGISRDIELMISKCDTCRRYQRSNMHETLIPSEIPQNSWEKVGVDLFYFNSKTYLILIDYYSKYVEVESLKNETSESVIQLMKSFFARFGVPRVVRSDNGPQFNCQQFKEFSENLEFHACYF